MTYRCGRGAAARAADTKQRFTEAELHAAAPLVRALVQCPDEHRVAALAIAAKVLFEGHVERFEPPAKPDPAEVGR